MDNIDEVYELAERIKQTIHEVYAEAGVTLPGRQYIIAGTPAHDCEQVTVSFVVLNTGLPQTTNSSANACVNPHNATFLVEVVRELPQGKGGVNRAPIVPSAVAIDSTAKLQLRDARLLAEVGHRMRVESWLENSGAYAIAVSEPSGTVQAVQMEINLIL